jgi:predicted pyridoxine 5'-phosphate oxidase superfamily flavin-nucleotide-binding protein
MSNQNTTEQDQAVVDKMAARVTTTKTTTALQDKVAASYVARRAAMAAATAATAPTGMIQCTCSERGHPGVHVSPTGIESDHRICEGHPGWMVPTTAKETQVVSRRNEPNAEIAELKARLEQQIKLVHCMFNAMPKTQRVKAQAAFKALA